MLHRVEWQASALLTISEEPEQQIGGRLTPLQDADDASRRNSRTTEGQPKGATGDFILHPS